MEHLKRCFQHPRIIRLLRIVLLRCYPSCTQLCTYFLWRTYICSDGMISADLHIHMYASSYIHKLQLDENMLIILVYVLVGLLVFLSKKWYLLVSFMHYWKCLTEVVQSKIVYSCFSCVMYKVVYSKVSSMHAIV